MVHSNLVPDTRRSLARATRGKTTWPLLESVAITTYCLTFSGNVNLPNRSEAEAESVQRGGKCLSPAPRLKVFIDLAVGLFAVLKELH